MAFYGIGGGTIATTSLVRAAHLDINAHSTSDWATAYTNNLAPGMYHVHICLSPSTHDGDANNGDADAYEFKCTLDGTTIGVVPLGKEDTPHTYKMTTTFSFVIGWTSGTKALKWEYRTTDADAGGIRGKLTVACSRIMDYA